MMVNAGVAAGFMQRPGMGYPGGYGVSANRTSVTAARNPQSLDQGRSVSPPSRGGLTPSEENLVERLEARDRQVRFREAAQAGREADEARGEVRFQYQTGPDGRRYAISAQSTRRLADASGAAAVASTAPDLPQGRGARTGSSGDGGGSSPLEDPRLRELASRDREVRDHENAHLAAAGQFARGGASYQYQVGPNGRPYAVGGSVQIDTSKESDPEATLAKVRQLRAAAMAPADPSGQDMRVAARISQMETEARAELQEERHQEREAVGLATGMASGGEGGEVGPAPGSSSRLASQAAALYRRYGG